MSNTDKSISTVSSVTINVYSGSDTYTQTFNDAATLSNLQLGQNSLTISEPTIKNLFNNAISNQDFTYSFSVTYGGVSGVDIPIADNVFTPVPTLNKTKPVILSATKAGGGYMGINIKWKFQESLISGNLRYFWQFRNNIYIEFPASSITRYGDDTFSCTTSPLEYVTAEYNDPVDPHVVRILVKNELSEQSLPSNSFPVSVELDAPIIDGGLLYPERVFKAGAAVNGMVLQGRAIFQLSTDNGATWGPETSTVFDPTAGNPWTYYYTSQVLSVGLVCKVRCYYIGSSGYAAGKKSPYTMTSFTVLNRTATNHPTSFSDTTGFTFEIMNNRKRNLKVNNFYFDILNSNAWHYYQFYLTPCNASGVATGGGSLWDLSASDHTAFTWVTLTGGDYWKLEQVGNYPVGIDNTNYYAIWRVPFNLDDTYGQLTNLTVRKSDHQSYLFEFDYTSNFLLDEIRLIGIESYSSNNITTYLSNFPIIKGRNTIDTKNFKIDNSTVQDRFYADNNNKGIVNMKVWQLYDQFRTSELVSVNTDLPYSSN
jgi:hypothetical protein